MVDFCQRLFQDDKEGADGRRRPADRHDDFFCSKSHPVKFKPVDIKDRYL